jgi:hypothetical protein
MKKHRNLLLRHLHDSGMTQREFANTVLFRHERTLRRWLYGERPIPKLLHPWLKKPTLPKWPAVPKPDDVTKESIGQLRESLRALRQGRKPDFEAAKDLEEDDWDDKSAEKWEKLLNDY